MTYQSSTPAKKRGFQIYDVLVLYILVAGAILRLLGYTWGEYQFLHPDERFMVWVGADIQLPGSIPQTLGTPPKANLPGWEWRANFPKQYSDCPAWGGYFDTACSPLNPNNRGHSFYVYGTLPLFIARYAVEWLQGHSGWVEMSNVGRPLSALADILVILLVYLAAEKTYNKRVGLLAAAFYAVAVLPIQLSHFFKEDTFLNLFTTLAVYFAVRIACGGWSEGREAVEGGALNRELGEQGSRGAEEREGEWEMIQPISPEVGGEGVREQGSAGAGERGSEEVPLSELRPSSSELGTPPLEIRTPNSGVAGLLKSFVRQPFFGFSLAFGFALGCAMASKVSALAVAAMLPVAFLVVWMNLPTEERSRRLVEIAGYVTLAAVVSLLTFRVFQPYAFMGPSFFGVKLNPQWIANITELRNQSAGDVDFPPAMQWARRPIYFAVKNLTLFGLGLPLGLLAWAGFLAAGWRILKGDWKRHAVVWGWVLIYYLWQWWQVSFTPTMRYFLPMYPMLVILAAWVLVELYDNRRQVADLGGNLAARTWRWAAAWSRGLAVFLGAGVLVATTAYAIAFVRAVYLQPTTRIAATRWIFQNIPGPLNLNIQTDTGVYNQPLPYPYGNTITPDRPYGTAFTPHADGTLHTITIGHVYDQALTGGQQTLSLTVTAQGGNQEVSAKATVTSDFAPGSSGHGSGVTFQLDPPLVVTKKQSYSLILGLQAGGGTLAVEGDGIANEGEWDDGIPLRMDGYDPFGGIYPVDLNFNMYWDDTPDKLERFVRIMDASNYIVFTSNRQWGSLPRIPERFPLSTLYYRELLGCPDDKTIDWCYSVAKPGMFTGALGYDLVEIFQSNPTLGPLSINEQFAEEAFTVYDHPKVLIFRKNTSYSTAVVRAILGSVDFSKVIHLTPKKAGANSPTLMLPAQRLEVQQQGGTWSDLFNPEAFQNRFEALGVIVWYLVVALVGLLAYPLVRLAFAGLPDRGYPLARTAGMVLLSWMVWFAGSFQVPFERVTISLAVLLIAIAGGALAYLQREGLRREWRENRKYFLMVEGLALAFFLFFLFIRLGNPDLWHPWKGGEKPMDFSFFNAVLKSTTFPPFDPWFTGGYLNYYYYGFVFVGVLVKWLGFVPSFAYNLILPTLFSLTALGAFSIGWNVIKARGAREWGNAGAEEQGRVGESVEGAEGVETPNVASASSAEAVEKQNVAFASSAEGVGTQEIAPVSGENNGDKRPFWAGVAAAMGMVLLGNLGTVRMIVQGYQRLIQPEDVIQSANLFNKIIFTTQGFVKAVTGTPLPYALADWYWIPSRVYPADEAITEFPFFTYLYADLHAHMMVMPIVMLALSWALAMVLGKGFAKRRTPTGAGDPDGSSLYYPDSKLATLLSVGLMFLFGGLAIGALYPGNTWDFYTYLALGVLATAYSLWCYLDVTVFERLLSFPKLVWRLLAVGGSVGLLFGLARLLYQPYYTWFGLGYTTVRVAQGPFSTLSSYLVHWGLFLFVIVSWMAWETRDWMAKTPVSALRKLVPFRWLILAILGMLVVLTAALQYWMMHRPVPTEYLWHGLSIVWLVLPLAAWAGLLLLRPNQPDTKRWVLFLVGTGLVITLVADVVVISDRMNMVFKFYMQVWALFAVSAAAALGWLMQALKGWYRAWRAPWTVVFWALVFSAAAFTLTASMAKVKDRMAPDVPLTLDGMTYMNYSTYDNAGIQIDTRQDYRAIRWLQENVKGSPVIVEAAAAGIQYQWYNRMTIYTGLPGVVGWEWHERQQRVVSGDPVTPRGQEVILFYLTIDPLQAMAFLQKYNVRYIIVGQLERGLYPESGLKKFTQFEGQLWRQVYNDEQMVIYEVIQTSASTP